MAQYSHRPFKCLLVGKSGSGKSTYQLRYVKNCRHSRVFIFDHKGEFRDKLGIEPLASLDELTDQLIEGEKFLSWEYRDEFPGDPEGAFQFFCRWTFEMCKELRGDGQKSLLVVDEVNRFTSVNELGYDFKELIEDGRIQGLDFLGTAHNANRINSNLRAQLTEIVALKTTDKRPLEFLSECGFDPEEIRALNVGEFILRDEWDEFHKGKLFSLQPGDVRSKPGQPNTEKTPCSFPSANSISTNTPEPQVSEIPSVSPSPGTSS
jgi:hypothetical protein